MGAGGPVHRRSQTKNKKYLSTDLCREEPVRDHYLSPQVELTGVRAVGRTHARTDWPRMCRA